MLSFAVALVFATDYPGKTFFDHRDNQNNTDVAKDASNSPLPGQFTCNGKVWCKASYSFVDQGDWSLKSPLYGTDDSAHVWRAGDHVDGGTANERWTAPNYSTDQGGNSWNHTAGEVEREWRIRVYHANNAEGATDDYNHRCRVEATSNSDASLKCRCYCKVKENKCDSSVCPLSDGGTDAGCNGAYGMDNSPITGNFQNDRFTNPEDGSGLTYAASTGEGRFITHTETTSGSATCTGAQKCNPTSTDHYGHNLATCPSTTWTHAYTTMAP